MTLASLVDDLAGRIRDEFNARRPIYNWPVGSIFFSVVPTNPNTLLGGGTWVAWGTGKMPVAIDAGQSEFNVVEETGGAKTHTLTAAEIPGHTHGFTGTAMGTHQHTGTTAAGEGAHTHPTTTSASGTSTLSLGRGTNTSNIVGGGPIGTNVNTEHQHTMTTSAVSAGTPAGTIANNTGGGGAHNNLPPYIVCYMWKRTA